MTQILEIQSEHKELISLLDLLERLISLEEKVPRKIIDKILAKFKSVWDVHEEKEDELFHKLSKKGIPISIEKMLIEQHRQLRGHWKVIEKTLQKADPEHLWAALNTDGRMLIDKFRNHINHEESAFKGLPRRLAE